MTDVLSKPAISPTVPGTLRRKRYRRGKHLPVVSVGFLALLVVLAILAPILSAQGQNEGSLSAALVPPFGTDSSGQFHLLGTDQSGRDVATRLLYGARTSLSVGVVGVLIAAIVGSAVGLLAGLGRALDVTLMRGVDVLLSIPPILVAILLASITRPSIWTVFIAIGLLLWASYARLVRGEVLALKTMDFVQLATVAGCSKRTIATRHILPNVLPSILVLATVHVGLAIVLEASLSFLGVGLPPDQASWGAMVNDGRRLLPIAWWPSVLPGLMIFLTVLAINRLGDWARIRFDPRLRTEG